MLPAKAALTILCGRRCGPVRCPASACLLSRMGTCIEPTLRMHAGSSRSTESTGSLICCLRDAARPRRWIGSSTARTTSGLALSSSLGVSMRRQPRDARDH
eukprot:Amastigsp_a841579_78.p2 type:complete len:101 gc:universal Amastigsp_a841579_78:488-790(+)